MPDDVYIYTLTDPRDLRIRYVGQCSDVKQRFGSHCRKQKGNNYRTNWLTLLRSLNLKPIMQVIEECDESNWAERETYWIKYYRNLGCDLVNATEGGEGTKGYKLSEEHSQKLHSANIGNKYTLGYKHTEETKQSIGNKSRGNKHVLGKHWKVSKEGRYNMSLAARGKRSKLTNANVLEIKRKLSLGISINNLVSEFKVARSTISDIKFNRTWSWLHE
jgi:group I intron endonuclease